MRVLEAAQVYRARLNGGTAPITLASDLKRGAYGYQPVANISQPVVPVLTGTVVTATNMPAGR